jgi:uncharacterized protein (DUF2235 family)
MPKNIVICADGTGNTTIKGRGTNVFKLYEAVDENGHELDPSLPQQAAIYHDGVGTESLKWIRFVTGATGWGLSRNVKQLYGELARVYDPGDRIFLFGFSRGAFTVRTLAGLIVTCGILNPDKYSTNVAFHRAIDEAYTAYRCKYQTLVSKWLHGVRTVHSAELRKRFSENIPGFTDPTQHVIEFIGVWDTVDAVGVPFRIADMINSVFYAFKFPDLALSPHVGHACHALALDEQRQSFTPVLWHEGNSERPERIQQVWFAGVHSNVGGGYPRQGLSFVSLDWMMTEAERHGLRFLPAVRYAFRVGADVHDRLYDSRSGLGVLYRWAPRDVLAICRAHGIDPKVHHTVYDRIARNTSGYAPGSLPFQSDVVSPHAPPWFNRSMRTLMTHHHHTQGALLDRHARLVRLGKAAYWTLIAGGLAFLALVVWAYIAGLERAKTANEAFHEFTNTAVSSGWIDLAAATLWRHPWVIAVIALGLTASVTIEQYLDTAYSGAWHLLRVKLRRFLESPVSRGKQVDVAECE